VFQTTCISEYTLSDGNRMFLFVESDGVQIFQIHSRAFSDYIVPKFSDVSTLPWVFKSFPFMLKADADIRFRAKSDGCRFIRVFSDRLLICIQMEVQVKLSEEIGIKLLKTFQWFFKACLDVRWFKKVFRFNSNNFLA